MRVLHTPSNLGNQPWVLSRHERELGIQSDLITHFVEPVFGYEVDLALGEKGGSSAAAVRSRVTAGVQTPFDYDILHYYYGRSLFSWDDTAASPHRFLDLKIAKALGRKLIFTLQGCDVRLASLSNLRNRHTMCAEGLCSEFAACIANTDFRRLELIREILPPYADKVFFLNPELGHYLPIPGAQFLPYASVEIEHFEVSPPRQAGPVRVVHAPSNPSIKGTALILAALDQLKDEFDLEVILVQGRSHAEAMAIYQTADLVIDQVFAGWYGGLAVEVMAMGKPVLCYIRDEDLGFVPQPMIDDLPIITIKPDQLVEDIRGALQARSAWSAWSDRSRRFVERWHNPAKIAAAMARIYEDPSRTLVLD